MDTVEQAVEEIVESIRKMRASAEELVKTVLRDKTQPLDKRWELLVKLSEVGVLPEQAFGDGYIDDVFGLDPYDDMYMERHQTYNYVEFLQYKLVEAFEEDESELAPEKIAEWKEKVLAAGYGSFTYDW